MEMKKFKKEDWRGGDLLNYSIIYIEVFRHNHWLPNELAESLNLFLQIVGKMLHIKNFYKLLTLFLIGQSKAQYTFGLQKCNKNAHYKLMTIIFSKI